MSTCSVKQCGDDISKFQNLEFENSLSLKSSLCISGATVSHISALSRGHFQNSSGVSKSDLLVLSSASSSFLMAPPLGSDSHDPPDKMEHFLSVFQSMMVPSEKIFQVLLEAHAQEKAASARETADLHTELLALRQQLDCYGVPVSTQADSSDVVSSGVLLGFSTSDVPLSPVVSSPLRVSLSRNNTSTSSDSQVQVLTKLLDVMSSNQSSFIDAISKLSSDNKSDSWSDWPKFSGDSKRFRS